MSQCSCSDQKSQDIALANTLIERANNCLNHEHRSLAEALLAAARQLILISTGDIRGEAAVWLLTTEGHLPLLDEDFRSSLWTFEEALRVAEEDLEPDHFAIGICLLNIAQTNLKLGFADDAIPEFERSRQIIESALKSQIRPELTQYFAGVLSMIEIELACAISRAEEA